MRDSWKSLNIGEEINILSGYPFNSKLFNSEKEGKPLIRIRDILNSSIETYFSGPYSDLFLIKEGDILVGMDGEFHVSKWRNIDALLNQRILKISQKKGAEIDIDYFYYFLFNFLKRIHNITPATTVKHLSTFDIKKAVSSFPPVSHQRKIAKILNTVDAVIESTETAIAKYKAIKQGMMQDLFTRGIDPQTGKLRPTQKEAPRLYKETELGWIPKEWEVDRLDNLSESYAGGTPNRSIPKYFGGTIPWVSSGEVNAEFIDSTKENITALGLNSSSAKLVPPNSVLIAMYGATAGQVSFLKIQATTNQAVLAILPNEKLNNIYLFYLLKKLKSKIIYLAQGSGQPNLSKNLVDKTLVVKPVIEEQEIIASRLKQMDKLIQEEQTNLSKHQSLKKGLMQDLLTGKVEVEV